MSQVTSIDNFALFSAASSLPAGYFYVLAQTGVYSYGPVFKNTYSIGVARSSDGVLIPGVEFYPNGNYATFQDQLTAMANEAYTIWNQHYLADQASAAAVTLLGF
jgi:hypothetical protein